MRTSAMAATLAAVMLVCGCAVEGPSSVISTAGPVPTDNRGTVAAFRIAYARAECSQNRVEPYCDSETARLYNNGTYDIKKKSAQDAYDVVAIGSDLSYQLCYEFFRHAGREQQWVIFGKDFFGIAGALAATVIGATSGSAAAVTWTGLAATGGISGLNLYERNFLFSTDNIADTQDLVLGGVRSAKAVALTADRDSTYTLSGAISILMQVQNACEVQSILKLVKTAISSAQAVAVTDAGGTSMEVAMASIGARLNNNSPISEPQLRALYWLYMSSTQPTADERKNIVALMVQGLSPSPLFANGDINPAFAGSVSLVQNAIGKMKDADKARLQNEIKPASGASTTAGTSGGSSASSAASSAGAGVAPASGTSVTKNTGAMFIAPGFKMGIAR